ncbi:MAG: hypothetical protein K2G25_06695 [Oscillospiraceae bacterium]|nr:hypothetical protein [Oscillospiraceae bacterium]
MLILKELLSMLTAHAAYFIRNMMLDHVPPSDVARMIETAVKIAADQYMDNKEVVKIQKIFLADNVITDEQYSYLMDCLKSDDIQWYYNMLVLAKTGTQVSEAIRLKKSDAVRGYAIISSKGKIWNCRRSHASTLATTSLWK